MPKNAKKKRSLPKKKGPKRAKPKRGQRQGLFQDRREGLIVALLLIGIAGLAMFTLFPGVFQSPITVDLGDDGDDSGDNGGSGNGGGGGNGNGDDDPYPGRDPGLPNGTWFEWRGRYENDPSGPGVDIFYDAIKFEIVGQNSTIYNFTYERKRFDDELYSSLDSTDIGLISVNISNCIILDSDVLDYPVGSGFIFISKLNLTTDDEFEVWAYEANVTLDVVAANVSYSVAEFSNEFVQSSITEGFAKQGSQTQFDYIVYESKFTGLAIVMILSHHTASSDFLVEYSLQDSNYFS